jgi:uncharacterized membrane protein
MKASIWEILSFFAIQYALGRRGSFPYGILVKLNLLEISILVVISDMIQTFLLLNFAGFLRKHLNFLGALKKKLRKKPKPKKSIKWEKLKKIGPLGLFLVSALPYAGGALSGSIMAASLKMKKTKAFFIILSGCIISTCLYYLASAGVISILK